MFILLAYGEMGETVTIRRFIAQDRPAIRRISCETAFLETVRAKIFSDDEILADALTVYFTDYAGQSCFVAVVDNRVVGYIIGAKDTALMGHIFHQRILSGLLLKAVKRGVFFKLNNLKFFWYCLISALKGEFAAPDFSRAFPATLHINLEKNFQGKGIGEKLIAQFLEYLREERVPGVHFGTFSEGAKSFFIKMGFDLLFQNKRSYLKPYLGKNLNFYVFGRKL